MNITFFESSIRLSQDNYIDNLVKKYENEKLHPSNTPATPKAYLSSSTEKEIADFKKTGKNY